MALTMKKVTTYGLGIAGGAVLNEISKRISAAINFPTEYVNIGVGIGLMAFSDKITDSPEWRDALELAGGVAAIGTVVGMLFKGVFGGARLSPAPAPAPAPVLRITPAPVTPREEIIRID